MKKPMIVVLCLLLCVTCGVGVFAQSEAVGVLPELTSSHDALVAQEGTASGDKQTVSLSRESVEPSARRGAATAVTLTDSPQAVLADIQEAVTAPLAESTEASAFSLSVFTKSVDTKNRQIVITVITQNPADTTLSGGVYAAITDQTGVAYTCGYNNLSMAPGQVRHTLVLPYTAEKGDTLTLYCWNGNLQPLCDPVAVPLVFEDTLTSLTVSPEKGQLILSEQQTLQLSATGDKPVPGLVFISENPAVATVSQSGLVTPVAPGQTQIVVVSSDYTVWDTCDILVISQPVKITLNQTKVNINASKTIDFQLVATVSPEDAPNKNLLYTSQNPKVAKVSATGLITAQSSGETTVTVTTADGAASAVCQVTVTAVPTGITLNKTKINMWDYASYQLTATVAGAPGATVSWKSSDDTVATVSDLGIVYGVAKGKATVTATVGTVKATCTVQVYREYDYTGTVAAYFESGDNPGNISGSGQSKSYGCFQLYAGSNSPKNFYNYLISTGFNADIGKTLKAAHEKDGGKDKTFGTNFDKAWKNLAETQREEFRSSQMAYGMSLYYEPIVNRLVSELNFYPDNYGLALKAAIWSRSIQHGTGGAFNRIKAAFQAIGGFEGKSEKALIDAIYEECGMVVSKPPYENSVPMNSSSSIAVENGLVGKYLKYYSTSSSAVQAGVWKRLHITEPKMLYDMMENPPVVITK